MAVMINFLVKVDFNTKYFREFFEFVVEPVGFGFGDVAVHGFEKR